MIWRAIVHSLGLMLLVLSILADRVRADEALQDSMLAGKPVRDFVNDFCLDCHNSADHAADLDLESISSVAVARNRKAWERVVRQLQARQMPPRDMPQPREATITGTLLMLTQKLDGIAAEHSRPGRTDTFRRLTRTEYQNAIRDLLALNIDATALLPKDESSQGFDNITVGGLSPTLLSRYVAAAQEISRLAVGSARQSPGGDTIRVRPDLTQDSHVPGLPVGTRGGVLIPYTFPQDGIYDIRVRLTRDRNEHVEGLREKHQLEVLLDRERMERFTVQPPSGGDHSQVDAHLTARFQIAAGPHRLGVTFLKRSAALLETSRQPYQAHFNMHRHPRINPAVYQVSITGPYQPTGPGNTSSRDHIFISKPEDHEKELDCAELILRSLARQAWRRPISDSDLVGPLAFFRQGRRSGNFDDGIESALAALLVSPHFLFRIERDPPALPPGSTYHVSDIALASRLSFFLWSSIPDRELLDAAARKELSRPQVLETQVRRMLADERSDSLVSNFAGQWLHLRNLDTVSPDMRLFPDFDDNLRQSMRMETELFCASILREDRSVLDLLQADYTFLNERLARHYDIAHVHGSRFRRVVIDRDSPRGGLLRHASILTVTSYATRTSPVIRGHWILQNLLGTPPPPPPPNVPALTENTVSASLPIRQRLAQHRADPNCAGCHNLMDPVGFSLENFDAVGRWRELEAGQPVDASGGLPDGSTFIGVAGLEKGLLERPELFVSTLTEKLLTYALGRGLDHNDAPAVRHIVRTARSDNFRFSTLILEIVKSTPFQMRAAE